MREIYLFKVNIFKDFCIGLWILVPEDNKFKVTIMHDFLKHLLHSKSIFTNKRTVIFVNFLTKLTLMLGVIDDTFIIRNVIVDHDLIQRIVSLIWTFKTIIVKEISILFFNNLFLCQMLPFFCLYYIMRYLYNRSKQRIDPLFHFSNCTFSIEYE